MKFTCLLLLTPIAILAGCATGPTPQNAQEFRDAASKGGLGLMNESYEVNKPYAKTAAILKAKSSECFDKTVSIQQCRGTLCSTYNYTLIPHVNIKAKSAELVVQMKPHHVNASEVYLGGPPPESGAYMAVADAVDLGKGKTQISVYSASFGFYGHIPKAIKLWTNQTNLGCPDFTSDP